MVNPRRDGGPAMNIPREALEQLADLLHQKAGLKITPDGYYGLRLAMHARMPALGLSDGLDYVHRLQTIAGEHELRSLLPLVTVGKTEFFRDGRQFRALETQLLPLVLRHARSEGRTALIWSAGCATGEEPYSLAMVLSDLGAEPSEAQILATDVNPAAVEFAKAGRFPRRRMGGVSDARLERYFDLVEAETTPAGGVLSEASQHGKLMFRARPSIRRFVTFEGQNLASPAFSGILPGSVDIVLCRNVIIYFDLPTIRGLMDRLHDVLRVGGVLLLGYSESLFKVYDKFEMFEVAGTFAYRRPTGPLPAPVELVPARPVPSKPAVERRVAPPPAQPAARPTVQPVPAPRPAPPPTAPPSTATPVQRLKSIADAMNVGQFDRALEEAESLCRDVPGELDALVTLGNLHSLMGHAPQARAAFDAVLSREPLCVEARVFGGLAALQIGDLQLAKGEFTKALFLEPALSIGHYLLAQVQERLGDADGARRSYRNAIAQLKIVQRPLVGHYPDMPESGDAVLRAARYALAALEEVTPRSV